MLFIAFFICKTVIAKAKNEMPSFFGYSIIHILSGSMEDEISANSYVLIKKCSPQEIKEGQIICFYSDDPSILGIPNTHRVVQCIETEDGLRFITKGDANLVQDSVMARAECLIGVYVGDLPFLTNILGLLKGNAFIIVLIILQIFSCSVAVYVFIKRKNETSNDVKQEEKNISKN